MISFTPVRLMIIAGLALTTVANAQQGPIDPTWVYTAPVQWKHPPHGLPTSSADIVILYPEGQFIQIRTLIAKYDGKVTLTEGDGLVLQNGTWLRTDERTIRILPRVVFRNGRNVSERSSPRTCALEGVSRTHLAATIHCANLIVRPDTFSLNPLDLQQLAEEAFNAARKSDIRYSKKSECLPNLVSSSRPKYKVMMMPSESVGELCRAYSPRFRP